MEIKLKEKTYIKGFVVLEGLSGNKCIFHIKEVSVIDSYVDAVVLKNKGGHTLASCKAHSGHEDQLDSLVTFLMEKIHMWAERKERG